MRQIPSSLKLGYIVIRTALGIVLVISGFNKIAYAWTDGPERLIRIGSTMQLFGISFGYLWWGCAAALTELIGGLAYIFNFFTRLVSLPLIWLFIVAITFHIHKSDPFSTWACAFLCLAICSGILIAGNDDNTPK